MEIITWRNFLQAEALGLNSLILMPALLLLSYRSPATLDVLGSRCDSLDTEGE